MKAITLWGAETPRSLRPIWLAEELGLVYDLHPIGPRTGETQTSEYKALNPKQKIPFLEDGETRLSESLAICRYLLSRYAHETVFLPDTIDSKAKEDEWCCYIYGELDETSLYVMRRHGDLADIYGDSEVAVSAAKDYLKRHLAVIDQYLQGRDHIMEQGFSLPDILLTTCLDWALFYGIELPGEISRYRDQIAQRPAYQKAMQVNYAKLFGEQNNGTA
ncbi:MAG: glutathione S-transferase family protein [Pseudomonadota bacterium]